VIEGDAQGLGALGRVLGHIAGDLLSAQLLVVLAVVAVVVAGDVAHMELLAPAGDQGHALVVVDRRTGDGHGGGRLLDGLLEQVGGELLGWR
jgi:hypothetical protein